MCVMVAWGLEASRRGQSEEEDRLEYQKSFSSFEQENLLSSSDAQQVFPPYGWQGSDGMDHVGIE
jgi:hypothetical protein